ncbi:GSCFA family protein [Salegentibacter echinorum]|uniref:GSCFA family protein n=1 Tax=Salegentibacter echinorum TaxID=1073325 RepID=A0A1M5HLX2_SALEC|nr:GSCFA domain-containing protein [Salegentibacter echinorum]SHG16911.1 GSCFA family protein [Salegentibacter echinorum]
MDFRTSIPIPKATPKITYDSRVFLVGSCFVENMGKKLDYYKFSHLQNPFGILFHPAAISKFFKNIAENRVYTESDIFWSNEQWHCFDAHSSLSHSEKRIFLKDLNTRLEDAGSFLQETTHLIITLGTAWSYFHVETGHMVANCHKIPQKFFKKELQSVEDIEVSLNNIILSLKEINPEITVIFTVSPVRHLKDGFVENQRSKAHLITAIHNLLESRESILPLGIKGVYFPAYELMIDELRDYRFYTGDMLHPSATAIDYIWSRFVETWFSQEAMQLLSKIETIQKGLSHRPFNPDSAAHLKFLKKLEQEISELQKQHPGIRF